MENNRPSNSGSSYVSLLFFWREKINAQRWENIAEENSTKDNSTQENSPQEKSTQEKCVGRISPTESHGKRPAVYACAVLFVNVYSV